MILTVDCGLSAVKAAIAGPDGGILATAREAYPTHGTRGRREQDPDGWWAALGAACRRLPAADLEKVRAVVPTGHMHALVALDGDLQPLLPCLTLHDRRGVDQLAQLDPEGVHRVTGQIADAALPLAKLLWLREADPELLSRIHLILSPKDVLAARLGGAPVTDPIDAAGTGLFDHAGGEWSADLLAAAGLDAGQVPEVRACTEPRGAVSTAAADALGVPAGALVLVGAGDDIELLGATGHRQGVAVEHVGTTGAILRTIDPGHSPVAPSVESYPTADPATDAVGASTTNCGGALDWGSRVLGVDPLATLGTAPRLHDPIVIPQFHPERTGSLPGALLADVDASHQRDDLARSLAVGVALSLADCMARVDTAQSPVSGIVTSGGSTDEQWMRLRASTYRRPIEVLRADPTVLGCVALGLVALGKFADAADAAREVTPPRQVVEPDDAMAAVLQQIAERRHSLLQQLNGRHAAPASALL